MKKENKKDNNGAENPEGGKEAKGAEKAKGAEAQTPLEKEIKELSEKANKADEYYDKWLRCRAELENTKKRLDREKEEFLKFANEDLIIRLIPAIDNFDRALASVRHTEESDAVLEGVKLVQRELHNILKDYGVKEVKSTGEKFDPHLHEAIGVVETGDFPEDTIVEEIQKGYTLNGRLVRPAVVKVSKRRNI